MVADIRVILLNGVGSVGKTSTARAFQRIASRPWLHVAMDAFLDMLPASMIGHPDGLVFEPTGQAGTPVMAIRSGPVVKRAMLGMRHAIAAMAAQGNNLIVDTVILNSDDVRVYRDLLAPLDLRVVGLLAPLEVLEQREQARGDRALGLARWQYDRVHRGIAYDLEIDATHASPMECAEQIRQAFDL